MKKLMKKGAAMVLAAMLLTLAGCKGNGSDKSNESFNQENQEKESNIDTNEGNAKGRYMESDLAFPEDLMQIRTVEKLEDGSIGLFDCEKGVYISKDEGETWEKRDSCLLDSIGIDNYIYHVAMGKDGSCFAMYFEDDGDEVSGNAAEAAADSDDEASDSMTEKADDSIIYNSASSGFKFVYVDKEGNVTQIHPNLQDGSFGDSLCILSDGRLLISLENTVYAVDKGTGEAVKLCEADDTYISQMKQIGNILYLVGSKISQYDLEAEAFLEDPVLDEFSEERLNITDGSYDTGGSKSILICEGDEENSVYIGCSDGLYRHVVGGNVMEEIMKGGLSSLGDPSLSYLTLIRKDNGEFIIGYFNKSTWEALLKKYVYDSEAAAVPENILRVYSLTENSSIRQAAADYQKHHSDVYVKYEVGLSNENSMTKEDAIRNLNTELLSGEGPDIILLDGMPVKSYMEKGIFADLSETLFANFEEDTFFENILNAYKKDGKLYAVPTRFQIPVIYSGKSVIEQITDLTTLADTVERLRNEHETGTITGIYKESEVLSKLYDVNSPAFITEDGSIRKEELTDFILQVKRIYQAEQKGISEEERKHHEETLASMVTYDLQYLSLEAGHDAFNYMEGKQQLGFGNSKCVSTSYLDYSAITSVLNQKEGEQQIKLMPGQKGNVFLPVSVMGVCENSSMKELAMNFLCDMLSEDLQAMSIETGYPVNKKAFTDSITSPYAGEEEEAKIGVSFVEAAADGDDMGDTVSLDIKWINEEEKKQLEEMVASLDTPAVSDDTIKEVVLELAPAALNGEKSVDEVVNEILNKIQIYLSE